MLYCGYLENYSIVPYGGDESHCPSSSLPFPQLFQVLEWKGHNFRNISPPSNLILLFFVGFYTFLFYILEKNRRSTKIGAFVAFNWIHFVRKVNVQNKNYQREEFFANWFVIFFCLCLIGLLSSSSLQFPKKHAYTQG